MNCSFSSGSPTAFNLNVMLCIVGVGVVCVMFFVLFKTVLAGRSKMREDIAHLTKEVDALKAALSTTQEHAHKDDGDEPVVVVATTQVEAVETKKEMEADDDLFEVVSITSNEIKDMLSSVVENIILESNLPRQEESEIQEEESETHAEIEVEVEVIAPAPAPDVKSMKIDDLRKLAASLGLDTKGVKTQLIERILSAQG